MNIALIAHDAKKELLVQFCIDAVPDIRDYIVEMNTLPAYLYGIGLFSFISLLSDNKKM